ncbi:MAG TPA: S53 family peptidase [Kineosporiaceae bacterium]|jgi:subtilase family serine protease|nr:S53 family peptidase [Kineosporiaceae bacterium]
MNRTSSRARRATLAVTAVAAVSAALAAAAPAASASAAPAAPRAATSQGFTPAIGVHPHYVKAGLPDADSTADPVQFGCQTVRPNRLTCYGPEQIRRAYGIDKLLNRHVTGKGRTIVIIDAYAPPNVAAELKTFTTTWGLPDADLTVVNPYGAGYDEKDPNQRGWASEIALDVQWAHVVAPDAKLVLVTAKTNDDADITAAIEYAVDHRLGDVISQSFGEDERCFDKDLLARTHAVYQRATALGITLTASSGDQGSAQPTCDGSSYSLAASYPASDPTNLAVGGTSLTADLTTGKYGSETVWNESLTFGSAGGGGFSTIFRKPWYQVGVVPGAYRGEPDVAYNAGINGGVLVYLDATPSTTGDEGFYIFGGTSSGAPQWAGLTALAAQVAHHSLGLLNDSIYLAARDQKVQDFLFHDITTGDNAYTFEDENGAAVTVPGYAAKRGWDAATGFGTPKAERVVPFLAATN